MRFAVGTLIASALLLACELETVPDGRDMTVEYRDGTSV
jgi:hypothetical protein